MIISYKYQDGTHYPSKAGDFLSIAKMIQEMHNQNIVHGDIRCMNMLHPYKSNESGKDKASVTSDKIGHKEIEESCLIDFDFSGEAGICKYPLGYRNLILDVVDVRAGKANNVMKKEDDWKDFISATGLFQPKNNPHVLVAWQKFLVGMTRSLKAREISCDDTAEKLEEFTTCGSRFFATTKCTGVYVK